MMRPMDVLFVSRGKLNWPGALRNRKRRFITGILKRFARILVGRGSRSKSAQAVRAVVRAQK